MILFKTVLRGLFCFSCIPDKLFRNFHQCWQILSYIPLFNPWDRQKTNNNTCCQYIGCIGGHVTLSLRRCKLTSLRCRIRLQLSIWRTSRYRNVTLMATPMLKSNAGDQKICKKKNISWLFGADRKIRPSGSLFGITQQSLVTPNSDPQTDFSIRTSQQWKIFIILHVHWMLPYFL